MMKLAMVVGVLLAAAWAMPAVGGPSLVSVDKREKQHYKSLDKRIKAAVLLTLNARVDNDVVRAPLTQQGATFSGSVRCNPGWTLTGGGVSWGAVYYPDYRVIESGPDAGGVQWQATVSVGGSPTPPAFPQVYVVCVKAA